MTIVPKKVNSGINNTPLHRHHQHDHTIKQYTLPIIHLLSSLLKSSAHYQYPMSPELSTSLKTLMDALNTSNDAAMPSHRVFMALWKTSWRTSKTTRMLDPTMCFLALYSLKDTGEFLLPKDVTGIIAKLC